MEDEESPVVTTPPPIRTGGDDDDYGEGDDAFPNHLPHIVLRHVNAQQRQQHSLTSRPRRPVMSDIHLARRLEMNHMDAERLNVLNSYDLEHANIRARNKTLQGASVDCLVLIW